MERKIKKYLYDIQVAIESIESFLGESRDFEVYDSNELLQSGCERKLEIIGEAMNRILKIEPDFKITNARKIVNFRNFISHEYEDVENDRIWLIIIRDLPKLKIEVNILLNT
jgi:uncharacterized protein with HEPN domain